MGNNKELGAEGEQIATDYLEKTGYQILERNYRYKRAEVDIIAKKEAMLLFVEVKYRANESFGFPEEFVRGRKIELIHMASEHYVEKINWKDNIRFDIISIMKKTIPEVIHLEDAF